jgi:pilus assembly protein Flp/PilA
VGTSAGVNFGGRVVRVARVLRIFARQDEGAALVEYGILIALIAVVCLVVVALLGNKVSSVFQAIVDKL